MNARERKSRESLNERSVKSCLRNILPARNGYLPVDSSSLIAEAERFGVRSARQFRKLLLRHRWALIAADRSALADAAYLSVLREDLGDSAVSEMQRQHRCFGWEALVRTAYELEFGEAYEKFARERDGL